MNRMPRTLVQKGMRSLKITTLKTHSCVNCCRKGGCHIVNQDQHSNFANIYNKWATSIKDNVTVILQTLIAADGR